MFQNKYAHLCIFRGLKQDEIELIDPLLETCFHPKDQLVFMQDQPAYYLYILLQGEVSISHKLYDGPQLTVAKILPGGVFGWSSVIGRPIYTSNAYAVIESYSYRIRQQNLFEFCRRHPDVGKTFLEHLTDVIAERLRNTHSEILTILFQGMGLEANIPERSSNNGNE